MLVILMNLKIKFFVLTRKIVLLSNNTENYPVVSFINTVVKNRVKMIAPCANNFHSYSHLLFYEQFFQING